MNWYTYQVLVGGDSFEEVCAYAPRLNKTSIKEL